MTTIATTPVERDETKPRRRWQTHPVIAWMLILYFIFSPYDLTPPLAWIVPQLSAEWVDLLQLPIIAIGFLLIVRERRQVKLPLWGAELMILLGSLIAMTTAVNLAEALETLLKDVYMYLFFLMVVNLVRDRSLIMLCLKIWVIWSVLQGGLMIFSAGVNFGKPALDPARLAAEQGLSDEGLSLQSQKLIKRQVLRAEGILVPGRQRGTIANSDLAGLYLAGGAILALAVPIARRRPWLKYVFFAIIMAGLVTTGSNGALVAVTTGLSVFFLASATARQRLLFLGLGATGLSVILLIFTVIPPDQLADTLADVSSVFENGISRIPDSIASRTDMLRSGFGQWAEKPIGLSPHGMRETLEERNTHNDYGAYLYERGYLGFTGLIFLLWASALRAWYGAMHSTGEFRTLMAALMGVVFVTIVNELVQEYMREREIWLTMAMIILLLEFEGKRRLASMRAEQMRRSPWSFSNDHESREAGDSTA